MWTLKLAVEPKSNPTKIWSVALLAQVVEDSCALTLEDKIPQFTNDEDDFLTTIFSHHSFPLKFMSASTAISNFQTPLLTAALPKVYQIDQAH